LVRALH